MFSQNELSVKRVRSLYETAVDHFGTSHPGKLVLLFCSFSLPFSGSEFNVFCYVLDSYGVISANALESGKRLGFCGGHGARRDLFLIYRPFAIRGM